MRILYLSNSYGPHDHRFLSALAQTEHQIFYIRLEDERYAAERRPVPTTVEQIHWAGGRSRFRWRDVPRLAIGLQREIRRIQPDLVHAGPIQTCAFLSVLAGFRPLVTMSWGFDLMQDADRNAWWRWITSFTLRRSTFFVSDAKVTRDRAVKFGMRPDRTVVFPWGIDLVEFSPGSRVARSGPKGTGRLARSPRLVPRPRLSGGKGLILFCNRSWEPRYGVDVLATAFARAVREDPRLSLILVGNGSQGPLIRSLLGDPEVTSRVLMLGRLPYAELPRCYRAADVFVSPSHVDGSSVSLMEALACGLPALVSDIPANKEWVRDGINGWLFRDGDVQALEDQILDLASRPGTFARQRKAARATAEKKADWDRNFEVLLETYQKAVRQA